MTEQNDNDIRRREIVMLRAIIASDRTSPDMLRMATAQFEELEPMDDHLAILHRAAIDVMREHLAHTTGERHDYE